MFMELFFCFSLVNVFFSLYILVLFCCENRFLSFVYILFVLFMNVMLDLSKGDMLFWIYDIIMLLYFFYSLKEVLVGLGLGNVLLMKLSLFLVRSVRRNVFD